MFRCGMDPLLGLRDSAAPYSSVTRIHRRLQAKLQAIAWVLLFVLAGFCCCTARADFTKTITVQPGVTTQAVATWYFLNCDISLGVGSYSVNVAPKYGTLSYATVSAVIPGCPSTSPPLPAAVAYYKWNFTGPAPDGSTSDYFQLYFNLNGGVAEVIDVTVRLQPQAVTISGPQSLWWFNGETPPQYVTQITLTASPAGYGPYTWTAGGTDGQVIFPNGKSSIVTNSNTVQATSSAPSVNALDCKVTATAAGVSSPPFGITILEPYRLRPLSARNTTINNVLFGYESHIFYEIDDQFAHPLPYNVPINEDWPVPVPVVDDYPDTNWDRITPPCYNFDHPAACVAVPPSGWFDKLQGELYGTTDVPLPLGPQTPLGNTPILHWSGEWRVGSGTPGQGVPVQTNIWLKYQDHGVHTSVISPVP